MNVLQLNHPLRIAGYATRLVFVLSPLLIIFPFMTDYPLLLRTAAAGLLAFTLWWTPMLLQIEKGQVQIINVQNLMATGFTLLFIVPGIYIAARADYFESVRDSGQYADCYPQALAMVSMTGFAFMIGMGAAGRFFARRGRKEFPRPPLRVSSRGLNFLFAAALALLWSVRIYLLYTGTYYHTLRTDYQYENSAMLAVIYTLESMSYLVIVTAFIQYLRGKWKVRGWVFAFLFTLDILWYVLGDQKASVFKIVFMVVTAVLMYRQITPRRFMMMAGAVVGLILFVIPLLNIYETVLYKFHCNPSSVSIARVVENLSEALESFDEGQLSPIDNAFQRLADIRSLGAVCSAVPDKVDFIRGESYVGILFAFVPHIVWPDKPDFEIRQALMRQIIPLQTIASSPLTMVGESFVNFSYAGIFGVFFIVGILAHMFNRWVIDAAAYNPWFGALVAVEGFRIMWTSMTLGQVVTPVARILLVALVLSRVMQGKRKVKRDA